MAEEGTKRIVLKLGGNASLKELLQQSGPFAGGTESLPWTKTLDTIT